MRWQAGGRLFRLAKFQHEIVSLSNRGVAIHFRSNGFDIRQPEECDIYTILKYLALVYPQSATAPEGPLDDATYKIIFTPSPRKFTEAGWIGACVLSPEVLPIAAPVPGARQDPHASRRGSE